MAKAGARRVGRAAKRSSSHTSKANRKQTPRTRKPPVKGTSRAATKRGGKWERIFFRTLAKKGTVWAACTAAKVTRAMVYVRKENDPAFSAAWEDALEDYRDSLEAVADKRARRNSDRMLEVLLKANIPEKYKDRVAVEPTKGILWDIPMPMPPAKTPATPS